MIPNARTWAVAGTLVVILAAGLWLRLSALHQESAWGDEALTTTCLPAADFSAYLDCVFAQDPRLRLAPVYYWVQYAWSLIAGDSLVSLRLLSVALYLVACIQIFALGRRIAGSQVGLWAAALFTLSLFQVYYGQEVRFYALMNVFALASLHGLVIYLRRPAIAPLALCFVANAALVWTHTFAVVFVLSQGLFMVFQWRQRRGVVHWFIAHAAMAVGLFGWLALLNYNFAEQSAAYRDMPAGPWELANAMLQFAGGRFSNMDPADYIAFGLSLDLVIAALVAALAGFALLRAVRQPQGEHAASVQRRETLLMLVTFAGPILALYALTWLWRPCFFSRYLIYTALPLHLLTAQGLANLPRRAMQRSVAVVVLLLFGWQNLALPRPFRADYQGVTRAIAGDPSPAITVLALKQFNYDAVAYALRDSHVNVEVQHGIIETVERARELVQRGDSVWVVFYRWDDVAAFTSELEAADASVRHIKTAGMPPLDVMHVTPASGVD